MAVKKKCLTAFTEMKTLNKNSKFGRLRILPLLNTLPPEVEHNLVLLI